MQDYHINLFYSAEDDGYIADIPDLPHCFAFGATPTEALREVLLAESTLKECVNEPLLQSVAEPPRCLPRVTPWANITPPFQGYRGTPSERR